MLEDFPLEMQVAHTKEETRCNVEKWLQANRTQFYNQFPDEFFELIVDSHVAQIWRPKRKR